MIDLKLLYTTLFGADESEAVNIHFEAVGYESSDFQINAGPILVFIIITPLYCSFTYILFKCC